MAYEKAVYDRVHQLLSQRRRAAFEEQARRRRECYERCPRLAQVDGELRRTGAGVAKAVISAGADRGELLEGLRQRGAALAEEKARLLRENGWPEDYLKPPFTCPDCQDTGAVGNRRCHCYGALLRQVEAERINRQSGLRLCSFDSFDLRYYSREGRPGDTPFEVMGEVLAYCKDYAAHFGLHSPNLLMMGATGLGKTHLSLAIASQVIQRGFSVLYGSFGNFVAILEREKFGADRQGDTLASLLGCDLLILDDLGSEFSTPFAVSTLYTLVNTRLSAGRPTIVNTNLTFAEISQAYTDRITSRLAGSYVDVRFVGSDVRLAMKNGF